MQALVEFTFSSFETEFPSPFGASIYLPTGELVSQAYDTVIRECDPTRHGEMNAVRLATVQLQRLSLAGCTLYTTCEPCPMCMAACVWAGLETVVSMLEDADQHWPQRMNLTAAELAAHIIREPQCRIVPHVERALCQTLFDKYAQSYPTINS